MLHEVILVTQITRLHKRKHTSNACGARSGGKMRKLSQCAMSLQLYRIVIVNLQRDRKTYHS
jgi:hypothetical protein